MRFHLISLTLAAAIASSGSAFGQALSCPPSSASPSCEIVHYHVALYRPDTRQFTEFDAIDQFASQPACERARDAAMRRNLAVVDSMKRVRNENQYEPDRFGPCHCDATFDRSSTVYKSDAQRLQQQRAAEDIRQRVRERLLDAGLTGDSELIRGLSVTPPALPLLGAPKLVPIPQPAVVASTTSSPNDLLMTRLAESGPTAAAALDLPLVDPMPPTAAGVATPSATTATTTPTTAPTTTASTTTASTPAAPAPQPALATVVVEAPPAPLPAPANPTPAATPTPEATFAAVPAPAPPPAAAATTSTEPETPAEDIAEAFVAYETQRIDKVLQASDAITDDDVKTKIQDACSQRISLLSNLRVLIQGSGVHSRLATAAQAAMTEPERLSVVAKLFGSDMPQHWAPKDASDVVLDARPDIEADPEKALRDTTGRFTDQQKRRALYVLLARTQPTEDQQLWLTTVIDRFLQGAS
jgi:hypothetical protein